VFNEEFGRRIARIKPMLEQSHIAEPERLPARVRPFQEARRRAFWLPVVVWMCVIFLLSSIPGAAPSSGFSFKSAFAHVFEFAVLAYLIARALYQYATFRLSPLKLGALTIAACFFYGLTDEFHQSFVRFREPSMLDLGFDLVGAFVGLAAARWSRSVLPSWRAGDA
jgi:VanZ family protein